MSEEIELTLPEPADGVEKYFADSLQVPSHDKVVRELSKDGQFIINDLYPAAAHAWHMATGICGEIGELLEALQTPNSAENIVEEMGDMEFFFMGACQAAFIDKEVKPKDYKGAIDQYDMCRLVIAGADVLDAAKRVAVYNDSTKWDLLRDKLRVFRTHMDRAYAVLQGVSYEMAVEANMIKLVTGPKARYKGGKFSNAAAQERADKA